MNKPIDSEDTIRDLLPVYSPRWGHQDHYSVVMSRSRLAVTLNTKTAGNGDSHQIWFHRGFLWVVL